MYVLTERQYAKQHQILLTNHDKVLTVKQIHQIQLKRQCVGISHI